MFSIRLAPCLFLIASLPAMADTTVLGQVEAFERTVPVVPPLAPIAFK